MATIESKEFELSASLEMPADKYKATVPDASLFVGANDSDHVQLKAGYIDAATGISYTVGQADGPMEEWSIDIDPASAVCSVGGRDNIADLLEHEYDCSYFRVWPTNQQIVDLEDAGITWKVGTFMASDIAAEIAASCGLELLWGCRNYTLWEDFSASGRAIDMITRLLDPWRQVPRFQADVYVDGKTLVCQSRAERFLNGPSYTYDVKDARIKTLQITRRRSQRYGHVLLYGQISPVGLRDNGGAGSTLEEVKSSDTYDENGNVLTRMVTTTTYRMPDKLVEKVVTQEYQRGPGGLKLTKKETRISDWEPTQYTMYGPVNQPKQLGQTTLIEGIDPSDSKGTWREVQKEQVGFAYDDEGYLEETSIRHWEYQKTAVGSTGGGGGGMPAYQGNWNQTISDLIQQDRDDLVAALMAKYGPEGKGTQVGPTIGGGTSGGLVETERTTKAVREVTHLETEEVTTIYKPRKGTRSATGGADWYVAKMDVSRSAGVRPGGPKPPRAISDSGPRLPVKLKETISDHIRARSVTYQNQNLTLDDLKYLMSCYRRASGNWEYTIQMTYMAMPWLRKGTVLQLTGLKDHTGLAIPLQPAVIMDQRIRYDESSDSPSLVSTLTAKFWTDDTE